jgi:hypothetical protein
MAATTREAVLAAIQARLPDNFSRKIRAADVRDVLSSVANSTVFVNEDIFDQIIAARDAAVAGVDYVPVAGGAFTGAVRFPSGTAALPGVTFSGDVDTGIWRPAADTLAASTNGSERLRITSTGNVGIGTTSPASTLQLETAGGGSSDLWGGRLLTLRNFAPGVFFEDRSTGDSNFLLSADGNSFRIQSTPNVDGTSISERMRITSTGNVGIGTNSPTEALMVQAAAGATIVARDGSARSVRMKSPDATDTLARIGTTSNHSLAIEAGTGSGSNNFMAFTTQGSERLRITSDGDVGIGSEAPNAKLEVRGGHSTTTLRLRAINAGLGDSSLCLWASEPSVSYKGSGIGRNVNGHPFYGRIDSDQGQAYLQFDTTDGFIINTGTGNATERMRIDASGNVGIGTSSPNAAALLDVTSTTSGFLPPRMTTTQRDAITSPPNGLMLYDTTTNKLQVRAGGAWVDLH